MVLVTINLLVLKSLLESAAAQGGKSSAETGEMRLENPAAPVGVPGASRELCLVWLP